MGTDGLQRVQGRVVQRALHLSRDLGRLTDRLLPDQDLVAHVQVPLQPPRRPAQGPQGEGHREPGRDQGDRRHRRRPGRCAGAGPRPRSPPRGAGPATRTPRTTAEIPPARGPAHTVTEATKRPATSSWAGQGPLNPEPSLQHLQGDQAPRRGDHAQPAGRGTGRSRPVGSPAGSPCPGRRSPRAGRSALSRPRRKDILGRAEDGGDGLSPAGAG